jgi:hypothetical protein
MSWLPKKIMQGGMEILYGIVAKNTFQTQVTTGNFLELLHIIVKHKPLWQIR